MKKGLVFLFAALLVVSLPLSAMAGTQIYKAKDLDVDFWEICEYRDGNPPVGPQQEFGKSVYIHYVGTEKFNARVKNGDVGWNRNVHGTATIYDANTGCSGEWCPSAASMPAADFYRASTMISMYPFACMPIPSEVVGIGNSVPLYEGPFQIEEVVQNDAATIPCFNANSPATVSYQECFSNPDGWAWFGQVDYLMYHGKITGNKIYFWKSTIHQPGVIQFEDKRGFNETWTYVPYEY